MWRMRSFLSPSLILLCIMFKDECDKEISIPNWPWVQAQKVVPAVSRSFFSLSFPNARTRMARRKPNQALPPPSPPTSTSTFRDVERFWKARRAPPSLAYALDTSAIEWEGGTTSDSEPQRGVWRNTETGEELACLRVRLAEVDEEGWKGKGKEGEEEWGIIITSVPGAFGLWFRWEWVGR